MNFSELELLIQFPFQRKLKPTLIDVGAHIGTSSHPFARKGWQVIAFEPEPQNLSRLRQNLGDFENVTIIAQAVSDRDGQEVPFYTSSEHWGIHSLKPFHETHKPQLTVKTVRLDTVLNTLKIDDVSLLKIDVEGADFLALQSFDFDRIQPEIVMCEFMDDRSQKNFGYSHHDMAHYMEERGYCVFVSEWAPIKEYAKQGQATEAHKFLQCTPYPLNHQPSWGNLLFVRRDRRSDFEIVLNRYIERLTAQKKHLIQNKKDAEKIPLEILLSQYEIAQKQQNYELIIQSLWQIVTHHPAYQPAAVALTDLLLNQGKLRDARTVIDQAQAFFVNAPEVEKRVRTLSHREEVMRHSNLRLRNFQNKHKGERCVIIGNGPSLNKMDLSFLKDEICFGLNRIYLGFDKWGFVPNYLVSVNRFVIEQSAEEIPKLPCTKFISLVGIPHMDFQEDLIFINSVTWPDFFSTTPEDGICIGSTVTYVTMQLAYYMGFETVILIGVDHSFETKGTPHKLIVSEGEDPNHFHPDYFGKGVKWQLPDLKNSEQVYKIADAYFRADGRRIIDATFEGHCPIFDKQDYREIFFQTQSHKIPTGGDRNFIPLNEICAAAYLYQKNPTDESRLSKLRQARRQIAEQCLNLDVETLDTVYSGELSRVYKAILETKIKNTSLSEEEKDFVDAIANQLNNAPKNSKILQILAIFLYLRGDRFPHEISDLPEWFLKDYITSAVTDHPCFQNPGELDEYYQYLTKLVTFVRDRVSNPIATQIWHEISHQILQLSLPPLQHDCLHNLAAVRAQVVEANLQLEGHQLSYDFATFTPDRTKIKLGILVENYIPTSAIFASIPLYKYLNRDRFEIILYTLNSTGHRLEKYCFGHGDLLVQLPEELEQQVQLIRDAELDILLIASDISTQVNAIALLAAHRLARIQIATAISPFTTGFSSIDYYITGKMSESESPGDYYSETLLSLETPALCFDFATEEKVLTETAINPQTLGIAEETVVYVSAANIAAITPEVETSWLQILSQVPQSVLVLCSNPQNHADSSSDGHSTIAFEHRIYRSFSEHNIDRDRLIWLKELPERADRRAYLNRCSIYLDPYSHLDLASAIEPLEAGLPVITLEKEVSPYQQIASLLRSLQMTDLIADSETAYVDLAVNLGNHPEIRRQTSDRVRQKMSEQPSFLDSRSYCNQVESIFEELIFNNQYAALQQDFRLRDINLIIFPDWNQPEEQLFQDLVNVIRAILTHPESHRITLIVDSGHLSEEDANLAISSVAMHLVMEEGLNVEEEAEITLLGEVDPTRWFALLKQIRARIIMEHDNSDRIHERQADRINAYKPDRIVDRV